MMAYFVRCWILYTLIRPLMASQSCFVAPLMTLYQPFTDIFDYLDTCNTCNNQNGTLTLTDNYFLLPDNVTLPSLVSID